MTGTTMVKMNSAILGSPKGVSAGKKESSQLDFESFINQIASSGQVEAQTQTDFVEDSQSNLKVGSVKKESYSSIQDKLPQKESVQEDAKEFSETSGMLKEKLEDFEKKMKESILESLNVSESELEAAMQALGFQFSDFMQPENLTTLVTQLAGNTEPVTLLMNEEFQQLFQTVEELTVSLLKDLGMNRNEVQQLLENMQLDTSVQMNPDDELIGQEVVIQSEIQKQEEADLVLQQSQETQAADGNSVEKALENLPKEIVNVEEQEIDEETNAKILADESMNLETEEIETDFSDDNTDSQNKENHLFSNAQNGNPVLDARTNTVGAVPQTAENFQTRVNVENIMRQITESVRVSMSREATSMELQLNPENLGKIHLMVTTKNGIVTAHMAAENEAVKNALENQIVQLRDNLNNQGLKVEAIEVTIASHEFERNLEENQQNNQKESERQNSGNRRRNLNVSDLEAIQGIMSEDENLAVKMMLQNGNSVDYSA
ncbi:flagellar hook-length control protein FliK [Anaerosacchariphilus polymeriproducens]|uniref:Flagellar hook-length control protein FliK n=1 Tax=Anaerosacchariphilus polymeriproducens TaxID=1812858 RepID=A0A371AS79_9FIRM|nr:flagellar hook-length control protein FliK [Anaerosacchariphilus polymeriproducens]RDU22431.1 flagellar hook-length control protein FliK [Anaerosacchariphilus polymeriproducens]